MAGAEERWKVNPLVLDGTWMGTQGTFPANCTVDGWWVVFVGGNIRTMMTVQQVQANQVLSEVSTQFDYATPPKKAPVRLEIFLKGPNGYVGVDVVNGSQIEWVPAGKDGAYGQTTLYLRRCPYGERAYGPAR